MWKLATPSILTVKTSSQIVPKSRNSWEFSLTQDSHYTVYNLLCIRYWATIDNFSGWLIASNRTSFDVYVYIQGSTSSTPFSVVPSPKLFSCSSLINEMFDYISSICMTMSKALLACDYTCMNSLLYYLYISITTACSSSHVSAWKQLCRVESGDHIAGIVVINGPADPATGMKTPDKLGKDMETGCS